MTTEIKTASPNNSVKKKKKFKMPSAMAIIVGVVIFATLLTWIPHAAGQAFAPEGSGWADGSLAAWQNYILTDALTNGGSFITPDGLLTITGTTDLSSLTDGTGNLLGGTLEGNAITDGESINSIISVFGLDGSWNYDKAWLDTETYVPWTIAGFGNGASSMFGLFDAFKAMFGGYWMAFDVAFYIIGMYALVLVLMESHTLKNGVTSLVKGLGGREILLVPILFILFSMGGTLFGMQEETLGLIPIVVPVLIVAGFDAPTGLLVTVVGTTSGIASSVLDPFSIGVMAAGLGGEIGDGILERLILFCVLTSVTCTMVTLYAVKVRKDNSKSIDVDSIEANKLWAEESIGDIEDLETMTGRQKVALSLFGLVFAWMIFSLMPWLTWFPSLADNAVWGFISSIFYGQVLLGEWYFMELGIMFLIFVVVIASVLEYKTSEAFGYIWKSAKEMFGVITIIAFSRAVSIILQASGLTYGMIYGMVDPSKLGGMGILTFSLIWLAILTLMAMFIPSTSGLAGITAPIIGGVITASSAAGGAEHTRLMMVGILMIYPLAQGCVNMFSPTTGMVVIQSEVAKVNYGKALPWLGMFAGVTMLLGIITSTLVIGAECLIHGLAIF